MIRPPRLTIRTLTPTRWMRQALCRHDPSPEWVTHPDQLGAVTRRRLANTCQQCPVRVDCYRYARNIGADHAIYAGFWWAKSPSKPWLPTQPHPLTEDMDMPQ